MSAQAPARPVPLARGWTDVVLVVTGSAVLTFRALTYVLPIPIGLATYIFWRRNRSWRREPNAAPRTELVPESA